MIQDKGSITGTTINDQEEEKSGSEFISFSRDAMLVCDLRGNIIEADESYCQMTGFAAEELSRMNLRDLEASTSSVSTGGDGAAVRQTRQGTAIEQILEFSGRGGGADANEQQPPRIESQHRRKEGGLIDLEITGAVRYRATGRVRIFYRDLGGQKQIEARLRETKERYRAFIEHSQTGIYRTEFSEPIPTSLPVEEQIRFCYERGFISECNDVAARLYGYERADDLVGKTMKELFVETDPENDAFMRNFLVSGYRLTDGESHEKDKNGDDKYFLNTLAGIVEDARLVRIWGSKRDVTEHKNVERLIQQSERYFYQILNLAPVQIWMSDVSRQCVYFNQRWLNFRGRTLEEELNDGWREGVHPEDLGEALRVNNEAFERREDFETEYRLRRRDGEYRWMLENGVPRYLPDGSFAGYLGVCLDITERKQAEKSLLESEAQMRQAQKLEAVGKLAGGIAHDFNNFLAVVMLHLDMLNLQIAENSPLRHRVNEIRSAAQGAGNLVRQLLAFSRKQMLQPRPLNLNHKIEELSEILRRLIGEHIELKLDLDSKLGVCLFDPDQLSQVLMNLVVNARDAMPDGGRLMIETRNIRVDQQNSPHRSQTPGDYVQLSVTDTGVGMSRETLEQLFEPFFTTKEPGQGTGLGLSTVYGIVKQSGGFIWASSALGMGSSFKIQLPQHVVETDDRLSVEEGAEEEEDAMQFIPVGSETILLVEDDEMICRVALEMLTALGYRVLLATDGLEGLERAREFKEPINLLIADVVLPKISGNELAERIAESHPETAVLFMSGYGDEVVVRHGIRERGVNFIEKPFMPSALAAKVREVLEGSSAATDGDGSGREKQITKWK